jgi:hypothetical protein
VRFLAIARNDKNGAIFDDKKTKLKILQIQVVHSTLIFRSVSLKFQKLCYMCFHCFKCNVIYFAFWRKQRF